jgi:hypothetical protein
MPSSLLDSLTALANPTLVDTVAGRLDEPATAVSHGLTASFGAILAGIVSKATDGGGLQQIFDLVRGNTGALQALENPAGLADQMAAGDRASPSPTGAPNTETVMGTGQELLSASLPGSVGSVSHLIAQASGLRANSVTSLMGLAAPLVLGVLGKRVQADGLTPASFGTLLASEKDSILRTAPAGVGGMVGLMDTARAAAGELTNAATMPLARSGGASGRWMWLLIIIIAILLFFWMTNRRRQPVATPAPVSMHLLDGSTVGFGANARPV